MSRKLRVLFLGGKEIGAACLRLLLQEQTALGYEVVGALTNRRILFNGQETVASLCAAAAVPVLDSLEQLAVAGEIDILISVQYHQILKPIHIANARRIAVNLHMAPLPEYRGCNQFSFAILNGDREFGTTLHRLEPGIDSGAILQERRFPIPPDATVAELYQLTFDHSMGLFAKALPTLIAGKYTLIPQASLLDTRPTSLHFRREIEELKQIDLSASAEEIYRRIRATSMPGFPPPYARLGRHKIEFLLSDE